MKVIFTLLTLAVIISWPLKAEFVLEKQPEITGEMRLNLAELCLVAGNTKTYLETYSDDSFAVHAGNEIFPELTLARVKKTLDYVCEMSKKQEEITSEMLLRHFDFYRWLPDKQQADNLALQSNNKVKKRLLTQIPQEQIFLTKYYTKLLDASEVQTERYNQALYQIPDDEVGLSIEQADHNKAQLTRYRFTRQEIIAGALIKERLAKPLIWLTEEALHDVLLQGTGVVKINETRRYFNVHRNNGIAYDYTKGKREQARYWYFAEVPSILGYGKTIDNKIAIKPDVTFAGNVKQLGLGKLFLINFTADQQRFNQIGVLADQGGAFDNNLFQLDFLKGSYYGWQDYYQANKHLPDYVNAWLMLIKE